MPAELQSSLVVAFSQRNRSQPAPRGVSPGNCAALRSDNGATGAGVCAAVTCPATTRGSAAAPAVAATDLTKPRRDSLFSSAIADSTRDSNGSTAYGRGARSTFTYSISVKSATATETRV